MRVLYGKITSARVGWQIMMVAGKHHKGPRVFLGGHVFKGHAPVSVAISATESFKGRGEIARSCGSKSKPKVDLCREIRKSRLNKSEETNKRDVRSRWHERERDERLGDGLEPLDQQQELMRQQIK
jgi:hypothetical protein